MTHQTLQAGAPNLPLPGGMKLRLEAISPTTDAEVAGVTVTRWSIYGYNDTDGPPVSDSIPRWVPEEDAG